MRFKNLPKLDNYSLYSSAKVNKSATLLTKLPWAKIKLATFRPWAEHCIIEAPNSQTLGLIAAT